MSRIFNRTPVVVAPFLIQIQKIIMAKNEKNSSGTPYKRLGLLLLGLSLLFFIIPAETAAQGSEEQLMAVSKPNLVGLGCNTLGILLIIIGIIKE
jgi:hypothetical protein